MLRGNPTSFTVSSLASWSVPSLPLSPLCNIVLGMHNWETQSKEATGSGSWVIFSPILPWERDSGANLEGWTSSCSLRFSEPRLYPFNTHLDLWAKSLVHRKGKMKEKPSIELPKIGTISVTEYFKYFIAFSHLFHFLLSWNLWRAALILPKTHEIKLRHTPVIAYPVPHSSWESQDQDASFRFPGHRTLSLEILKLCNPFIWSHKSPTHRSIEWTSPECLQLDIKAQLLINEMCITTPYG